MYTNSLECQNQTTGKAYANKIGPDQAAPNSDL